VSILQFDMEHGVWESLPDDTLYFNSFFFSHKTSSEYYPSW
jgi:hypothetical protein